MKVNHSLAVAMLTTCGIFMAQGPTVPVKYEPTHEEALQLENDQLKAQNINSQLQRLRDLEDAAQEHMNEQMRKLKTDCVAVVKAHKWPEHVTCNFDTLVFSEGPAAPTTPPATQQPPPPPTVQPAPPTVQPKGAK